MTDPFHEIKLPEPAAGESSVFVQWKGTEVCADFSCKCGSHQHICREMFMYSIKCTSCGQHYKVQSTLFLAPCEPREHSLTGEDRNDEPAEGVEVVKCEGFASDDFIVVVPEPDADYLAKQADILIQDQWASIERESVEHFLKSGSGLDAYCRVLFGREPTPEEKANRVLPDITFTIPRKP